MWSALPSELGRENAKLLRGLPRGEAMGEAPGMRCTRDSYLVFNARLSSCRLLTNCVVIPKPAYIPTSATADQLSKRLRWREVTSSKRGERKRMAQEKREGCERHTFFARFNNPFSLGQQPAQLLSGLFQQPALGSRSIPATPTIAGLKQLGSNR